MTLAEGDVLQVVVANIDFHLQLFEVQQIGESIPVIRRNKGRVQDRSDASRVVGGDDVCDEGRDLILIEMDHVLR